MAVQGRNQRRELARRRRQVNQAAVECRRCGKRAYPSEIAAMDVVAATGGRAGGRVYWSELCEAWHVTAQRKR